MPARVRKLVLPDAPRAPRSVPAAEEDAQVALPRAASWLLPFLLLGAVVAAALLVLRGPDALFAWALAALFGVGMLWIVVSVFYPPHAERGCPRCGADALERLDPDSTVGLRCKACGHVDEEASGWLLAEEEGPLEDIVMTQRGRRRKAAGERRKALREGTS